MYELGMMLYHGKYFEANPERAIELFEAASKKGNDDATCSLAFIHFNKEEYQTAMDLFRKSCSNGNDVSMLNLAFIYENGRFVDRSFEKAAELYHKSSEKGNSMATYALAQMYEDGRGVDLNLEKACTLYLEALDEGIEKAKKRLCYVVGSGRVCWRKEVHIFWKSNPIYEELLTHNSSEKVEYTLNDQIACLLLISKTRNLSTLKFVTCMVRGIVFEVIKFLCHLRQK